MAKSKRIWRESQHPRDARGRFSRRGGAAWIKRAGAEVAAQAGSGETRTATGRPRISRQAKAGVTLQAHADGGRPSPVRVPQATVTPVASPKNLAAFTAKRLPAQKRTPRPSPAAAAMLAARNEEQAPHVPAMVAARAVPEAAPVAGADAYAAMRRHTLLALARDAKIGIRGKSNTQIANELAAHDAKVKADRAAKLNPSGVGVDTPRANSQDGGMTSITPRKQIPRSTKEQAISPKLSDVQKANYDKMLGDGPASVTHKQSRQIVEQLEAHGWSLVGNEPMVGLLKFRAPDGREISAQHLVGQYNSKPRFFTGSAQRGTDLTYKAALAHVITPTLKEVDGPNIREAAKRIGLDVPYLSDVGGRNDPTLRPIQDAQQGMHQKGSYGGRGESAEVAAANLRAAAVRNRETAKRADELYGYGGARDQRSELLEQRADQFEKIADELEKMTQERAAYEAERDRRAALPPDIRPGRSALTPKGAKKAVKAAAPKADAAKAPEFAPEMPEAEIDALIRGNGQYPDEFTLEQKRQWLESYQKLHGAAKPQTQNDVSPTVKALRDRIRGIEVGQEFADVHGDRMGGDEDEQARAKVAARRELADLKAKLLEAERAERGYNLTPSRAFAKLSDDALERAIKAARPGTKKLEALRAERDARAAARFKAAHPKADAAPVVAPAPRFRVQMRSVAGRPMYYVYDDKGEEQFRTRQKHMADDRVDSLNQDAAEVTARGRISPDAKRGAIASLDTSRVKSQNGGASNFPTTEAAMKNGDTILVPAGADLTRKDTYRLANVRILTEPNEFGDVQVRGDVVRGDGRPGRHGSRHAVVSRDKVSVVDTPRDKSQNGGMTTTLGTVSDVQPGDVITYPGTDALGNPAPNHLRVSSVNGNLVAGEVLRADGTSRGKSGRFDLGGKPIDIQRTEAATPAPAEPGETTLGVTESSKGRTTTVTLPDGTTAQRTSKTMAYSHAVVATHDLHADARDLRAKAEVMQRYNDAYEAWIERGANLDELVAVDTGTGSVNDDRAGLVNYAHYLPGFPPVENRTSRGGRWYSSAPGTFQITGSQAHRSGKGGHTYSDYEGYKNHPERLIKARQSREEALAKAAELEAGPQHEYYVARWSQRVDTAHAAIGSPEVNARNTRYQVIGVGGVATDSGKPAKKVPTAEERAAAAEAKKADEKARRAKSDQDFVDRTRAAVERAIDEGGDPEAALRSKTDKALRFLAKAVGAKLSRKPQTAYGTPASLDAAEARRLIVDAIRARSAGTPDAPVTPKRGSIEAKIETKKKEVERRESAASIAFGARTSTGSRIQSRRESTARAALSKAQMELRQLERELRERDAAAPESTGPTPAVPAVPAPETRTVWVDARGRTVSDPSQVEIVRGQVTRRTIPAPTSNVGPGNVPVGGTDTDRQAARPRLEINGKPESDQAYAVRTAPSRQAALNLLNGHQAAGLRAIAREEGVVTSGTKADLVARLMRVMRDRHEDGEAIERMVNRDRSTQSPATTVTPPRTNARRITPAEYLSGTPQRLTRDEKTAIDQWVDGQNADGTQMVYREIQQHLWTDGSLPLSAATRRHMENLQSAISRHTVPEDIVVSRYVNRTSLGLGPRGAGAKSVETVAGTTIRNKGFLAATLSDSIDRHIGGALERSDIKMNISVPKGTHAVYVDIPGNTQQELIMPPGTTLAIRSVERRVTGEWMVNAEVVADTPATSGPITPTMTGAQLLAQRRAARG